MTLPNIILFDDVLDQDLIETAYELGKKRNAASYPFFNFSDGPDDEDPTFKVMRELAYDLWVNIVPETLKPEKYAGTELWHNNMYEGDGLHEHVDVDEKAEELSAPYWGGVMYLGPKEPMRGGSLHANVTSYKVNLGRERKPLIVPFKQNRVVLFQECVHWVGPVLQLANSDQPRIALACPLWEHPIDPFVRNGPHANEPHSNVRHWSEIKQ